MGPSARTTVALGLGLVLAGAAFDSPSLYVPGVALLLLAGLAGPWIRLAARGAQLDRLPGAPTVVEGEPYPLEIRVRRGVVPPHGELIDPLLPRPLPVGLRPRGGGVAAGWARNEVVLRGETAFERRGRHRLEPTRLVLRDPLGIRSRELRGGERAEVLVLPRIEPVLATGGPASEDGQPFAGVGDGAGAGLRATLDVEVDGLRPYRPGSPASRIHWPAVARHRELIERRLVSGGEGAALVVLDSERPASEEALDCAVRAAASLVLHMAGAGGCSLLLAGAHGPLRIDSQLRGWPQAHARLAMVESGGTLATRALPARGASFWVTASRDGWRPSVLAGSEATAWFAVTPFHPSDAQVAFEVAGCHGFLVGARRTGAAGRRRSAVESPA